MPATRSTLRAPRGKSSGAPLLEYALGLTLIALSVLAVSQLLGCKVNTAFLNVTHSFARAF